MSGVFIPNILLAIPRNPITAVGLPVALGFLSGSPASKVANSNWYYVSIILTPSLPTGLAFIP
jgi:benzodiazapine receptor